MRLYRKATKPGYKVCNRCNTELPAEPEYFLKDKSRSDGLAYECKPCHRERKKGRDRRKERWSHMTPQQKEKAKSRHKRYSKTEKGRIISLLNAYKKADECDFTSDELVIFLRAPCIHCGTIDEPRGLDRIDNKKGHTKDNVAPACRYCNVARSDRFSFEEMKEIGQAIRSVLARRKSG